MDLNRMVRMDATLVSFITLGFACVALFIYSNPLIVIHNNVKARILANREVLTLINYFVHSSIHRIELSSIFNQKIYST